MILSFIKIRGGCSPAISLRREKNPPGGHNLYSATTMPCLSHTNLQGITSHFGSSSGKAVTFAHLPMAALLRQSSRGQNPLFQRALTDFQP
jgi:hypothetical protein